MFKNRKNSVSICLLGGKKKTVKQMKKYRSSRPKVFCKKNSSQKSRKIQRKTPLLESIFNRITALMYFHENFPKYLSASIL